MRSGRLSTGFARLAKFPDFALNHSIQFVNPTRESLRVCFPSNPFTKFDHPVAIFWGHLVYILPLSTVARYTGKSFHCLWRNKQIFKIELD